MRIYLEMYYTFGHFDSLGKHARENFQIVTKSLIVQVGGHFCYPFPLFFSTPLYLCANVYDAYKKFAIYDLFIDIQETTAPRDRSAVAMPRTRGPMRLASTKDGPESDDVFSVRIGSSSLTQKDREEMGIYHFF